MRIYVLRIERINESTCLANQSPTAQTEVGQIKHIMNVNTHYHYKFSINIFILKINLVLCYEHEQANQPKFHS